MHRIYIELTDTEDGRTRYYRGYEFFRKGDRRIGWFTYYLFDKDKTVKRVEFSLPYIPNGTLKVFIDGVVDLDIHHLLRKRGMNAG